MNEATEIPTIEKSPNYAIVDAFMDFLDAFEVVFGDDWEYTKECIGQGHLYIHDYPGTFLHPGIQQESTNWEARRCLLLTYRHLTKLIEDAPRRSADQ